MQQNYNRYHTDLQLAAIAGALPANIAIPRSTLGSWYKKDWSVVLQLERDESARFLHRIRELRRHTHMHVTVDALLAVNAILMDALDALRGSKRALKEQHKRVVALVREFAGEIPRARFLEWFRISSQRLSYWSSEVARCGNSILGLCRVRHPHQLLKKEILRIARLLRCPPDPAWPRISTYWYGIREKLIACSSTTFYRYARDLGFKGQNKGRDKPRRVGVRAVMPGQILHADVSEIRLADRTKAFIYILVDSFSRKILALRAELKRLSCHTGDNLLDALRNIRNCLKRIPIWL